MAGFGCHKNMRRLLMSAITGAIIVNIVCMSGLAASNSWQWKGDGALQASAAEIQSIDTPPEDVYDGWAVSHLSAEGITPKPIATLIRHIENGDYTGIDGIVIARNGALVAEAYFNGFKRYSLHQTRSSFKSVTGLLTLIALSEGVLTLDTPVAPLIARFHPRQDGDPRKADMTVRNLLNMRSGFHCSEMPGKGPRREEASNGSPDKVALDFDVPMAGEPGRDWRYCSGNTFLLGVALESALAARDAGTLKFFLNDRLMHPLGIHHYRIGKTAKGRLPMHGGERIRPRDMAKFGQLLLSKGLWRGRRIVPQEWIEALLAPGVETGWSWTRSLGEDDQFQRTSRYRFKWFQTTMHILGKDYRLIHSWGNGGQFIIAVPQLALLIVVTGSNFGDPKIDEQKQVFHMLHRFILPATIGPARR